MSRADEVIARMREVEADRDPRGAVDLSRWEVCALLARIENVEQERDRAKAESMEWLAAARQLNNATSGDEENAALARLDALRTGNGDVDLPQGIRTMLVDQRSVALAERDAALARVAEVGRERDAAHAKADAFFDLVCFGKRQLDEARARVVEVERERDEAREFIREVHLVECKRIAKERDTARAQLAAAEEGRRVLREALEAGTKLIANVYAHYSEDEVERARSTSQLGDWRDGLRVLRAALTPPASKGDGQ